LQRRRFRIADTARKTKPQRSHAPPAKSNSTAEHRRRANTRPRWTRLRLDLLKGWTPAPLYHRRRGRGETGAKANGGGGGERTHRRFRPCRPGGDTGAMGLFSLCFRLAELCKPYEYVLLQSFSLTYAQWQVGTDDPPLRTSCVTTYRATAAGVKQSTRRLWRLCW
jgi:hypothetical protein